MCSAGGEPHPDARGPPAAPRRIPGKYNQHGMLHFLQGAPTRLPFDFRTRWIFEGTPTGIPPVRRTIRRFRRVWRLLEPRAHLPCSNRPRRVAHAFNAMALGGLGQQLGSSVSIMDIQNQVKNSPARKERRNSRRERVHQHCDVPLWQPSPCRSPESSCTRHYVVLLPVLRILLNCHGPGRPCL